MIFSGQLDATFVGLDQATGRIVWKTQLEDYREGYSITGATRYYDGLVFTGMSGGEYGIRGRIYALDAKTGREVWRFYTVPGPGEIGAETWPMNDPDPVIANIYQHGGATVWQAPAVDPELGMLYFSTGNASPWEGSLRPGDNLFTASIVALDYQDGPVPLALPAGASTRSGTTTCPTRRCCSTRSTTACRARGSVQAGKTGWLYFLDRTNGEPLIGMEYRPVPPDRAGAQLCRTRRHAAVPGRRRVRQPVPEPMPHVSRLHGLHLHPVLGHPGADRPPAAVARTGTRRRTTRRRATSSCSASSSNRRTRSTR